MLAIKTLRQGLWTNVASRRHVAKTVYFASDSEMMLYGTVSYVLRADPGSEVEVPWAVRAVFDESRDGGLKLRFYQVYLVSFLSLLGLGKC